MACTLKLADAPLNETFVAPVKPWPRISAVLPTLPSQVTSLANGFKPMSKL
jgi:hypothetical protein